MLHHKRKNIDDYCQEDPKVTIISQRFLEWPITA